MGLSRGENKVARIKDRIEDLQRTLGLPVKTEDLRQLLKKKETKKRNQFRRVSQ
jgi:hypothetical protein